MIEGSAEEPVEFMYNKIDLILYFYLDYMNPLNGMTDRRISLHDVAITTLGDILLSRVKADPKMFKNLQFHRTIAENLSQCLDHELGSNSGSDSVSLKVLYNLLLHSIS